MPDREQETPVLQTPGRCDRTVLTAADGHRIHTVRWTPVSSAAPVVAVQILHGLAEHIGRYARFSDACVGRGFAVIGHDHRGHGAQAEPAKGHFADDDGWTKVVEDAIAVRRFAASTWPDTPLVLFGHSMGSYIAQSVVSRQPRSPRSYRAMVLSASTLGSPRRLRIGRLLARLAAWSSGGRAKSAWLNRLGLGGFNKRFAPNRTAFDWLSRDAAEVDRYIDDPYCGMLLSNRLWHDLLGGLIEISTSKTLHRIPADMPVLVTGGEHDPVGGRQGQTALAQAYRQSGHSAVTMKLYEGGRHEMLNETNRDEFTKDVLDWIGNAAQRSERAP